MTPHQQQPAYRQLVEQLMHHGWYRAGSGPRTDGGRLTWGFREGHLLEMEARPSETLWIAAPDEGTAMELLLTELRARQTAPRWPRAQASEPTAGEGVGVASGPR
jgi:hypothetical protein